MKQCPSCYSGRIIYKRKDLDWGFGGDTTLANNYNNLDYTEDDERLYNNYNGVSVDQYECLDCGMIWAKDADINNIIKIIIDKWKEESGYAK